MATLVLGLSVDPLFRWYFPEPHEYLANVPTFLKLVGGDAFEHNTAMYMEGYVCSALWLPPDIHPDVNAIQKFLTEKLDGLRLEEARAVEEQFEKLTPDMSCWHLVVIAADPTQTGKGYGSKMLEHMLRVCDEDKKPVYLESSSPANMRLYQRYGFEVIGEIQAGSSPIVRPMMRQPK